jgi:hypothetical protein
VVEGTAAVVRVVDRRRGRSGRWLAALVAVAAGSGGCAAPAYSACPIELPDGVPAHAFAACRELLLQRFGALVTADEAAFRLQTAWIVCPELPGERRAAVFRQVDDAGACLGVVVELRRLSEPLLGLPGWTAPRGDAAAERELAESLRAAIMP